MNLFLEASYILRPLRILLSAPIIEAESSLIAEMESVTLRNPPMPEVSLTSSFLVSSTALFKAAPFAPDDAFMTSGVMTLVNFFSPANNEIDS